MRYAGVQILKTDKGIRYFKTVKYPEIPLSENDIYIITAWGDRADALAADYYNTEEDYWVILTANGLPGDSLFFTPGTQLRIPSNILKIKADFNKLNNIS